MFTEGLMVNRTDVLNPDVGLTGGFIAALASFLRLHFSIVFARSENVAAVMIFVTLQQCMVAVDNGGSERRRCKCSGSIDGPRPILLAGISPEIPHSQQQLEPLLA
jgi:hypothetical protein